MAEIPKAYDPQAVEDRWYEQWLKQGCFTADPSRVAEARPAYSIVIPPPNVTGMLHMGHVLNNTIQDILARKARMDGKEVLWLPGTDHAGIATEGMVAKQLKKEEKKSKQEIGREEFLKRVWTWKEKHGGIIIGQLKKLGCSCDWTRERFTMDEDYVRCVQQVFVDLYKKGLIYRGKRMVNWCPATQTALSDEEVEMKPQKGFMYHFKVEVAEMPGTWLTIATTRPETIPGDSAVAVNPKDPRYAHLVGKQIVRPLPAELPHEQKLIPIVGDEHVDFEFGTGVLKVTPAHDKADFEIGLRHNLPRIEVIHADGSMSALAGQDLNGLDRFKARKVAVEKLRELGALVEEKPYENNVGFSQRADVPIEPRLSEQWFLKYPSVEISKACVAEGRMKFHPDRWAKVYDHWLTNIQDWCISRQLWWGHRVPVWSNQSGLDSLEKTVVLVALSGSELAGSNARELRAAAWGLAERSGFLRQRFRNHDTGWDIYVNRRSLEHAFASRGIANVKLVPALPELLNHAIHVGSESHVPAIPQVKLVHRFLGALRLGSDIYQVKFTVKELQDGRKLYDHQALILKKNEADGKSPGTRSLSETLVTRPASASFMKVADLVRDVNTDELFVRAQVDSPGEGWTQDPDVLDTWFSSWLWPFATMGWTGDKTRDSKIPALRAFYPTTDLVTGPDIIFFWVARMIMAGYEYMEEMPFKNVYFTGIIRDKQGRKMSKTLGNSPDPLELIAKYGADALRFGTMRSAPLGQDVLFDEKDVELGRNFCNKLWNACRFRQMQGGGTEGEIDPALLTSDDKWILLRLDQAIRELDAAYADYRFSEVAAVLYRFFWSEYCDWYVEASKSVFVRGGGEELGQGTQNTDASSEDQRRIANKLAVIDFVLGNLLRLFHPFLPFISEELWHGMGYDAELPGDRGGKTIMNAAWPKPLGDEEKQYFGLDETSDQLAKAKYDLVVLGRNLRVQFNIPSGKRVKFILKPAGDPARTEIASLKILLNAEPLVLAEPSWAAERGTPVASSTMGDLYMPLEGLVDVAAERSRLTKELEKIVSEIRKVEEKLSNPNFTQKVPTAVLEEHRRRAEDWKAKEQQIRASISALG